MKEAIEILQQLKEEYQNKILAIDEAISALYEHEAKAPSSFNHVIKNEPFDFSTVKDFNPSGGGIRSDL